MYLFFFIICQIDGKYTYKTKMGRKDKNSHTGRVPSTYSCRISPLDCHSSSLYWEMKGAGIPRFEFSPLAAKYTRRLNGNGDKVMAGHKGGVLLFLSSLCFIGNTTGLSRCQCDVGWSKCIWACSIPYIRTHPSFHGTIVAPSGHLPSDCEMPVGSRCAGIFTAANDLLIKSLIAA